LFGYGIKRAIGYHLRAHSCWKKTDENQIAMTWKNLQGTTNVTSRYSSPTKSLYLSKTKRATQRHRNIKPTKITTNCHLDSKAIFSCGSWSLQVHLVQFQQLLNNLH